MPGTARPPPPISAAVSDLPMPARKTLTWDQGAEMARHDLIAHLFPDGVYFAYPGSPWQRGTNENMHGLRTATIDDLR
jgi:IS30 family transposase